MNERERVHDLIRQIGDPLQVLRALNGFYECPKDVDGKRIGPLVGYAGKDPKGRQYVGEVYANFCEMEQWPHVMCFFGQQLVKPNGLLPNLDCLCGAPLGGMTFGAVMADILSCRYIFPEKVITAAANEHQREESVLKFSRHKILPGEKIGVVEDVTNNFSTTDKLIKLIQDADATVSALICLLNRSLKVDSIYVSALTGREIPVISVVRKRIQQWEQDDPAVAEDVAKGNVVWKPKNEWGRLMAAMEK